MFWVLVNSAAIVAGSLAGFVLRNIMSEKIGKAVMTGMGLCTIYIGISGMNSGGSVLVLILSTALGAAAGTALDIDGFFERAGDRLQKKFGGNGESSSIAEGFVSASILVCIGAMSILGPMNAVILNDESLIVTKSALDFVGALMMTIGMGIGVMFSALPLLVVEGAVAVMAGIIKPYVTAELLAEISLWGSVTLMAIGFNIVGISKIKVADYVPSLLFIPIVFYAMQAI